jgi:hypothetical protein
MCTSLPPGTLLVRPSGFGIERDVTVDLALQKIGFESGSPCCGVEYRTRNSHPSKVHAGRKEKQQDKIRTKSSNASACGPVDPEKADNAKLRVQSSLGSRSRMVLSTMKAPHTS